MDRTWRNGELIHDFYGENGSHNFGKTGYFPPVVLSKSEVLPLLLVKHAPALSTQPYVNSMLT